VYRGYRGAAVVSPFGGGCSSPSASYSNNRFDNPLVASLDFGRIIQTGLNRGSVEKTVEDFGEWLEKRYKIVLKSEKGDIVVLNAKKRFDYAYVKRVVRRLQRSFCEWISERAEFTHIVLTMKSSEDLGIIPFRLYHFKRAWNSLLTYLHKYHLSRNLEDFGYFCVLEPHKSGFPHLHIVVKTPYYLIPQRKLSELWCRYTGSRVVYIRRVRNRREVFYLLKYLLKQYRISEWNERLWVYYAYLWWCRCRSYSVSRGFYRLWLRSLSGERWVLLGVVEHGDLDSFLRGLGLDMRYLFEVRYGYWQYLSPPPLTP